jgi:hypothetical protein
MGCHARAGDVSGVDLQADGFGRRCFRLLLSHSFRHSLQFGEPWVSSVRSFQELFGRRQAEGLRPLFGSRFGADEEPWFKSFLDSGLEFFGVVSVRCLTAGSRW